MYRGKSIKEELLGGKSVADLVAEGHCKGSVIRAMRELENGIGVKDMGRRPKEEPQITPNMHKALSSEDVDEQYRMLAVTIVRVALDDLIRCYRLEKKNSKKKSNSHSEIPAYASSTLERWFRTDAIMLMNIDPETVIKMAKYKADNPKTKGKGRKSKWMPRDSYVTKNDHRRKEYRNG